MHESIRTLLFLYIVKIHSMLIMVFDVIYIGGNKFFVLFYIFNSHKWILLLLITVSIYNAPL